MENERKKMDNFPDESWRANNGLNKVILRNSDHSNFFSVQKLSYREMGSE
jgi:hypothetical protein